MLRQLLPRITHRTSNIGYRSSDSGERSSDGGNAVKQLFHAIQDLRCKLGLELERLLDLAVGRDENRGIGVGVEAGVFARNVVGDDQVYLLGRELLPGARARVAGLGGEADQH